MPRAVLLGHCAAQLDGEVRNAQPRIDRVARARPARWPRWGRRRCSGGRCRSGRAAGRPGAISSETSSSPRKNHEPLCLVDQAGVLADPAQPRQPRVGALQQRRRIHADLRFELRARAFPQHGVQPLQARAAARRDNRRPRRSARSRPRSPSSNCVEYGHGVLIQLAHANRPTAPRPADCADRRAPPRAGPSGSRISPAKPAATHSRYQRARPSAGSAARHAGQFEAALRAPARGCRPPSNLQPHRPHQLDGVALAHHARPHHVVEHDPAVFDVVLEMHVGGALAQARRRCPPAPGRAW